MSNGWYQYEYDSVRPPPLYPAPARRPLGPPPPPGRRPLGPPPPPGRRPLGRRPLRPHQPLARRPMGPPWRSGIYPVMPPRQGWSGPSLFYDPRETTYAPNENPITPLNVAWYRYFSERPSFFPPPPPPPTFTDAMSPCVPWTSWTPWGARRLSIKFDMPVQESQIVIPRRPHPESFSVVPSPSLDYPAIREPHTSRCSSYFRTHSVPCKRHNHNSRPTSHSACSECSMCISSSRSSLSVRLRPSRPQSPTTPTSRELREEIRSFFMNLGSSSDQFTATQGALRNLGSPPRQTTHEPNALCVSPRPIQFSTISPASPSPPLFEVTSPNREAARQLTQRQSPPLALPSGSGEFPSQQSGQIGTSSGTDANSYPARALERRQTLRRRRRLSEPRPEHHPIDTRRPTNE